VTLALMKTMRGDQADFAKLRAIHVLAANAFREESRALPGEQPNRLR
jgi:hypothetical protein